MRSKRESREGPCALDSSETALWRIANHILYFEVGTAATPCTGQLRSEDGMSAIDALIEVSQLPHNTRQIAQNTEGRGRLDASSCFELDVVLRVGIGILSRMSRCALVSV